MTALHSTNPIESLFSRVRACEKNIKHYRNSRMAQRWLASVRLYAEKSLRALKGHGSRSARLLSAGMAEFLVQ